MPFWNRTKIVATLGPASANKTELEAMINAGVDIIRINGAHGDDEQHRSMISLVRKVSGRAGVSIAILFDLPGPKIRLGTLKDKKKQLKRGETLVFACGKNVQTDDRIPVSAAFVAASVKKGNFIYVNDGLVKLKVKAVHGRDVECTVISSGWISSKKGLNLPGAKLNVSSLTPNDKKLLSLALDEGVDYVGLSFVRTAKNVADLRKLINKKSRDVGIIAKIEKPEAVDNLDAIIEKADAIMVARGDLGIEMAFDKLPIIQRMILKKCREAGKPSITATQMMESMVSASTPTRAEVADIAMAVWEGTDAVMLSEETSIGQNPAKAVFAMSKVAYQAESEMLSMGHTHLRKSDKKELQAQVIAFAADDIADELNAKAIVAPTRSGRTALFISNARPSTSIVAPTESAAIARRMCLYWGVMPMMMPTFDTVDELLRHAESVVLKSRIVKKGDNIVMVSGAHGKKDDITKLIEVRKV